MRRVSTVASRKFGTNPDGCLKDSCMSISAMWLRQIENVDIVIQMVKGDLESDSLPI